MMHQLSCSEWVACAELVHYRAYHLLLLPDYVCITVQYMKTELLETLIFMYHNGGGWEASRQSMQYKGLMIGFVTSICIYR